MFPFKNKVKDLYLPPDILPHSLINSRGLTHSCVSPQNMSDAMAVLPKLSTGLDVNVRFTGVSDFEYTPECIVFDLLNIPLYHGWLLDPQVNGLNVKS